MKLAGKPKLEHFKLEHPLTKGTLDAWRAEVEDATWQNPEELAARYSRAILEGEGCVTFQLQGDQIKIRTLIRYESQVALVQRISMNDEERQAA